MRRRIYLLGKEGINIVGWALVLLTIMSLVGTLLTTYKFTYIKYCGDFRNFQICLAATMVAMSIKLLEFKKKEINWIYSALCLFIAIGTIYFIWSDVY